MLFAGKYLYSSSQAYTDLFIALVSMSHYTKLNESIFNILNDMRSYLLYVPYKVWLNYCAEKVLYLCIWINTVFILCFTAMPSRGGHSRSLQVLLCMLSLAATPNLPPTYLFYTKGVAPGRNKKRMPSTKMMDRYSQMESYCIWDVSGCSAFESIQVLKRWKYRQRRAVPVY